MLDFYRGSYPPVFIGAAAAAAAAPDTLRVLLAAPFVSDVEPLLKV